MAEQVIDVVIHLDSSVLTGSLFLGGSGRLSDYLNSGVKFIGLHDVTVIRPNGIVEKLDVIHINKEAIKMLITVSSDAGRGVGADYRHKVFPFVRKVPVHAKMQLTGFEVDGNLHCKNADAIPQLLERDNTFLPCTDARIRNIQENTSWRASFAAVNRTKVNLLQKVVESDPQLN